MNPDQLFGKLRSLVASFSSSQLVTLGLTFLLVVGLLVGSTYFIQKPTFAVLFSNMDAESAGQVVEKLKTLKVKYELDDGGTTVRVPSSQLNEMRLQLTAAGLPSSGRVGFEIFDRTAFGATEFMEKVNYRRALEGEIARTIATISEVASARVHIAMAKDSIFGEPRPAKASVVLKLKGTRTPAASTIAGITGLVAASVEGLRADAVVVVDSTGRPLARPGSDENDPLAVAQTERQQRLEADISRKVVALLEPVVGPERVRVNVAVKLNAQSREETEERWDPNSAVIRTRQMSSDTVGGAAGGAGGGMVAGARGNAPPPPQPAPVPGQPAANAAAAQVAAAGPLGPSRNTESTNYEVSRLTRRTVSPAGDTARLSVAVILDDARVAKKQQDGTFVMVKAPRTKDELQKVQALVAAAVGLDTQRGDLLTVEHMSFDDPPQEEVKAPSIVERYTEQVTEFSKLGLGLGMLFVLFLLVIRPLMKRLSKTPAVAAAVAAVVPAMSPAAVVMAAANGATPRTVADLESEVEAQLAAQIGDPSADGLRIPVMTKRAATMSSQEPESVARLLRTWMREKDK